MKLSAIFARYLYQRKQLSLPGIGIFSIDPSVHIPEASEKAGAEFLQHIHYEQKNIVLPDEDLINFIRTETGKIKPLAESDLDSFLSDGKILLNIGKPFYIDGIGSLMKTKSGVLEFKPGEPVLPKLETYPNEINPDEVSKKRMGYGEDYTQSNVGRKLLIALALIGGIVLIIWGGYTLYNRNNTPDTATTTPEITSAVPTDTAQKNKLLDTVKKIIAAETSAPAAQRSASSTGGFRYIIEKTAIKERALKRYNQLRDNRADIQMETKDSVLFTLYFVIPSTPADTARVRDSLRNWYARKTVLVTPN